MHHDLKNHHEQQDSFSLFSSEEAGWILLALVGALVLLDLTGALGG